MGANRRAETTGDVTAVPPRAPTAHTSPARTDGALANRSITDYRRGDLTQIRLPGLNLAEQRIRRAMRRIRESVLPLARTGYEREQIDAALADLHIAIDAIQ